MFALEDRCAHRQVPLQDGVVDGCAMRCGYHGWTYDKTGKCIDVPYLGKDKLPNGVRAYACREAAGLVFVFPGDPALAETVPFPALGAADDPRYRTRRFGQEVGCHYTFMHENLTDMNHQFLHRKQMGQVRPRFRGMRTGDEWMEVDYTFGRTGGKQPLGEAAILGKRRGTGKENHKDLMTIRTEYPYQNLRIWTDGELPVMNLWIVYVPLDREQRTNRTFGLLSIQRPEPCGFCSMRPGRCWCGLPSASSRKIAGSWRKSKRRTTTRGPTGTRRCFPPSGSCVPCSADAAWRNRHRRSIQGRPCRQEQRECDPATPMAGDAGRCRCPCGSPARVDGPITVAPIAPADRAAAIPGFGALRVAVFRAWPYLYDGDAAYEADYLVFMWTARAQHSSWRVRANGSSVLPPACP